MTEAEKSVVEWAFNLAKSVVAGDYKLPKPMNIAINGLQDAVHDLAAERGMKDIAEGCSQDFLAKSAEFWKEVNEKLKNHGLPA